MMTHKKSALQICDSYKLQSINLDTIYKHLEHFKETGWFEKKKNDSSIKAVECYNCDIKRHYTQDCHKLKKSQVLAVIR